MSIASSILGAIAFLTLVFIWPLQMIASALLVVSAVMVMSIYAAARQARSAGHDVGWRHVDHEVPVVAAVVLVLGVVVSFLWPEEVAVVALATTFLACAAWMLYELITHNASRTRGDGRR